MSRLLRSADGLITVNPDGSVTLNVSDPATLPVATSVPSDAKLVALSGGVATLLPANLLTAGSALLPNKTNSIIQYATGRTVGGRVVAPARLAQKPYVGNSVICMYSGYPDNTYGLLLQASDAADLLPLTSDDSNQAVGISVYTAIASTIGYSNVTSRNDAANVALLEVNGLPTRSVAHGKCGLSGSALTVPIPATSAAATVLVHVETDNTPHLSSLSSGAVLLSDFGAHELGGGHGAWQVQVAGSSSTSTLTLTFDATPNNPVYSLLSLAP